MPARSTVITVLSKRGDNGISPLMTSQLLQMAGRAGRRGLDVLGNVVLMRSRFEDVNDAHRLLLSPLDAIESKFKTSYRYAQKAIIIILSMTYMCAWPIRRCIQACDEKC
jgi:superfamily II RNA helicase